MFRILLMQHRAFLILHGIFSTLNQYFWLTNIQTEKGFAIGFWSENLLRTLWNFEGLKHKWVFVAS